MGPPRRLQGLYIILDAHASPHRCLTDILLHSAEAGARIFQYRNKGASMQTCLREARALRKVAWDHEVLLIINDRCDLAKAVQADGVHLGQDDMPFSEARNFLGHDFLIGVSTHTSPQVRQATEDGADYLGFGPIFRTSTKKDHEPLVGLEGLRAARACTPLPIFAIGGITPFQVQSLLKAGADGYAVVSAIAQAEDLTSTVQSFLHPFP